VVTTATSYRLREDVTDKLRVLAASQDRSRSNMIKNLIEQEYNRLGREIGRDELERLEQRVLAD
jgi:predicted transcriptional regulator